MLPTILLAGLAGCPRAIEQRNYVPSTVYTMMVPSDIERFDYFDPHYRSPSTEGLFLGYVGPVSAINLPDGSAFIYAGREEDHEKFIVDASPNWAGDEVEHHLFRGDQLGVGDGYLIRLEESGLAEVVDRETGEKNQIPKAVVLLLRDEDN